MLKSHHSAVLLDLPDNQMTGELPALLASLQTYNRRRAIYFCIIWQGSKERVREKEHMHGLSKPQITLFPRSYLESTV